MKSAAAAVTKGFIDLTKSTTPDGASVVRSHVHMSDDVPVATAVPESPPPTPPSQAQHPFVPRTASRTPPAPPMPQSLIEFWQRLELLGMGEQPNPPGLRLPQLSLHERATYAVVPPDDKAMVS